MNKVTALLKEFGDFVANHIDFADETGENILQKFSEYGYTDPTTGQMKFDKDGSPLGRDTVLCPEMPTKLRRVEIALRKLDYLQSSSIRLVYCSPHDRGDGRPYTISQMARILRINKGKFKASVRKGKRRLAGLL